MHPGDIQLATNRIPTEPDHPLLALRNCIVFSHKGERDLPSQLSGGDLDGDIYSVIWDQEAVQQCIHLSPPADYPRVEPMNIGREVQLEDMIEFFIQFMQTDQLGLIAIKHMILADQRDDGTFDQGKKTKKKKKLQSFPFLIKFLFTLRTIPTDMVPHLDCQVLAGMHSTAVDYSKTGIPVNMVPLRTMKQSRYRPDLSVPPRLPKYLLSHVLVARC